MKKNMSANAPRYSRQILFSEIGLDGQRRLSKGSVTLIGCGGLGSVIATSLVRSGVGKLKIVDRDYVEEENLLHQTMYDEGDARRHLPKATAARHRLQRVNSKISIEASVTDVHYGNIEEIVGGSHVVMDGTDNFETRYLINDACVKKNIPWVYGAAAGSRGMCTTIVPGVTPCLRCIFPQAPPPESLHTCDTSGVILPAVQIVASLQVTECLRLLTGRHTPSGDLVYCDAWEGYQTRTKLARQKECPACRYGKYPALRPRKGASVNALCGRNTVLITYYEPKPIDLTSLNRKLAPLGRTALSRDLLMFRIDDYQLAIFPDGRAIIKGTEDPNLARTLYSKYIGN